MSTSEQQLARRVLLWPQVHERVGLSRPTVWRMERDGSFPRRVRVGSNRAGWFSDEIDAWIARLQRV